MSVFNLAFGSLLPSTDESENETLSLVWWPTFTIVLGMVAGMAVAETLSGNFLSLLGLALSLVTLPVGQWLAEVWPSMEELSNFIIGGYVPPVYEEELPVPQDGWVEAMLAEVVEDLPEEYILPLPSPTPAPRTSREVLTDLLRQASTQALEHLLDLPKEEEELDMHAEACKTFIWV